MDFLDRKIKPSPKGRIVFDLPVIKTFNLDNSLKVYYVQKNTLPIIQINLLIPSGSIRNINNKHGQSALTSMLIDEGAGKLTGLEISDKLEFLGSILNINSNKEYTTLSLLTLKENLEESISILSLIVQSPHLNDFDFDRELQRLNNQILQLNDNPSYIASNEIQKLIFRNTPYQYPSTGLLNSVKSLSNNEIKEFHRKKYSPNGSYLIIVGDVEEDIAFKTLNKYFVSWKNKNKPEPLQINIAPRKKQVFLIDKSDAAQSEIRIGHYSKDRLSKDFYARTVLNSILGGQFSSRINLNLREDKGFTYGANSNYSYNQYGSTFIISTSVKTENTISAIKEILIELELIKTTIKEHELEFSKSYLIRRYPSLFETYTQVTTNASLLPIYNLEKDYFANYISNIEKVTLNDVIDAANENILIDKLLIVVVGNKRLIEKDLKDLAESQNFEY